MGKWAKGVGNEHSKGESLLCLVTSLLQVEAGACTYQDGPCAPGLSHQLHCHSALSLQPGEFFIPQAANIYM